MSSVASRSRFCGTNSHHPIVVLDCEGSDGRERGEDATFEKKSALLSLAAADVVLLNIWCHDIGREQGSGKPLLKTILQVHLKLFRPKARSSCPREDAPNPNPNPNPRHDHRRTTLVFVIRDQTRTPLPQLQELLMDDLLTLWGGLEKPHAYQQTRFRDLFDVRFHALPSFEADPEAFRAAAIPLRRAFDLDLDLDLDVDLHRSSSSSSPTNEGDPRPQNKKEDDHDHDRDHGETALGEGMMLVAGVRETLRRSLADPDRTPGHALATSMSHMWAAISQDQDINIPAHRILVARVRCAQIAADQLALWDADERWIRLGVGHQPPRDPAPNTLFSDHSDLINRETPTDHGDGAGHGDGDGDGDGSSVKHLRAATTTTTMTTCLATPDSPFGEVVEGLVASRLSAYDEATELFDASVRAEHHASLADRLWTSALDVAQAQLIVCGTTVRQQLASSALRFPLADFATRLTETLAHHEDTLRRTAAALTPQSAPWDLDRALASARTALSDDGQSARVNRLRLAFTKAMRPYLAAAATAVTETLTTGSWNREPGSTRSGSGSGSCTWEESAVGGMAGTGGGGGGDGARALWRALRRVTWALRVEATPRVRAYLSGLGLTVAEEEALEPAVRTRIRRAVVTALRQATKTPEAILREVFQLHFGWDRGTGAPQMWGAEVDIPAKAAAARARCVVVLAGLCISLPETLVDLEVDPATLTGNKNKNNNNDKNNEDDDADDEGDNDARVSLAAAAAAAGEDTWGVLVDRVERCVWDMVVGCGPGPESDGSEVEMRYYERVAAVTVPGLPRDRDACRVLRSWPEGLTPGTPGTSAGHSRSRWRSRSRSRSTSSSNPDGDASADDDEILRLNSSDDDDDDKNDADDDHGRKDGRPSENHGGWLPSSEPTAGPESLVSWLSRGESAEGESFTLTLAFLLHSPLTPTCPP